MTLDDTEETWCGEIGVRILRGVIAEAMADFAMPRGCCWCVCGMLCAMVWSMIISGDG